MFFAANIKLLRTRRRRSQADLADILQVKRSSLSGYELGTAFPNYETLIRISDFFKVTIDKMLRIDLSRISELQLSELEKGYYLDLTGRGLRVLASTVNSRNEDNIEMVSATVKAGYKNGYSDPDFIKVLPTFQLPFLSKERKYRSFQISGDSMPPVSDGSWVTAEYMQNWTLIKEGYPYVILTKDDGLVFKIVFNRLSKNKCLLLCSSNPEYKPYEVHASEILEVWKFVNYTDSNPPDSNRVKTPLIEAVQKLQSEVDSVKKLLG